MPVVPNGKTDKEVFWVERLVKKISLSDYSYIKANKDNSNGNHDVIIGMNNTNDIGIQVTELTSEIKRERDCM